VHHASTAVVLPYPAGAATSVNADGSAAERDVSSRGLSTRPGRDRGGASLASASGTDSATGPGCIRPLAGQYSATYYSSESKRTDS
jgi:hypothetical protein